MHESISDTIRALNVKLIGNCMYYGICGNNMDLQKYYKYADRRYEKARGAGIKFYI